ncbi:universal stress protein [Nakamurella panacisegetis]|uniref:universal stress protein n=1 Tax=Nakamurella panacisegetis TaxID=1090615 RepID=UPI000B811340|nr:universal stress protein [Nakamurella panacisegetis]
MTRAQDAPSEHAERTAVMPDSLRGSVIVGVDGSPASLEAIRMGHRLAGALGLPLSAIHIWHPSSPLRVPPSWHPHDDAMTMLAHSVRVAFEPEPAPDVQLFVERGDAASSLIECSDGAAMLVVGRKATRSGLGGALMGSVSSACAAHARCPVLVVQQPGDADGSA